MQKLKFFIRAFFLFILLLIPSVSFAATPSLQQTGLLFNDIDSFDDLFAINNNIYVLGHDYDSPKFTILDASNTKFIKKVGQYTGSWQYKDGVTHRIIYNKVFVANNFAYIVKTNYFNGKVSPVPNIDVFDVTDSSLPTKKSTFDLFANKASAGVMDMLTSGEYSYIIGREKDNTSVISDAVFKIVDTSNSNELKNISTLKLSPYFSLNRLAISGHYAFITFGSYASSSNGFYVIDINDKTNPQLVQTYAIDHSINSKLAYAVPMDFAVSGNYAYVYLGNTNKSLPVPSILVMDISNPISPQLVSIFESQTHSYSADKKFRVQSIGQNYIYGYALDKDSGRYVIDIIDISNPAQLTISNSIEQKEIIPNTNINHYAFLTAEKIYKFTDSNAIMESGMTLATDLFQVLERSQSDTSGDGQTPTKKPEIPSTSSCPVIADEAPSPSIIQRFKGGIVLQTEGRGEAWYIHPTDHKRYCLGKPQDAYSVMRSVGIGISNANLAKIPTNGETFQGDLNFRKKMTGKILLQIESRGEAWYVSPKDLKKYYLGKPSDALKVMKGLGTGISDSNLAKIPTTADTPTSKKGISYNAKSLKTLRGTFAVNMVIADLANSKIQILTDTAGITKEGLIRTQPLKNYVTGNKAVAGINGTFFQAQGTTFYGGSSKAVFNSNNKTFTTNGNEGPLVVFNNENNWIVYSDVKDFPGKDYFEQQYNTKIRAAISNDPLLIYNSRMFYNEERWDKQFYPKLYNKTLRSGLGLKGTKVYFIAARGANVGDLAAVMESLGMEYAINLDGGGSSALYYNGAYKVGPGRNIPNAIVVAER